MLQCLSACCIIENSGAHAGSDVWDISRRGEATNELDNFAASEAGRQSLRHSYSKIAVDSQTVDRPPAEQVLSSSMSLPLFSDP